MLIIAAANEDVVEDLLTRPVPIHFANAPPASNAPPPSTAPPTLTSASVPRKGSADKAVSKVPRKPKLLLKLKLPKAAFVPLEHREDEHAVADQDEEGTCRVHISQPRILC